MKVRYSLSARTELEEITNYIARRNPRAAARLLGNLRSAIDLLRAFPKRGRLQRRKEVRRLDVGRFPYNIYYHLDEVAQQITILTIRHTARRRRYRDA